MYLLCTLTHSSLLVTLDAFLSLSRELVPTPQNRVLLTWATAPYAFGYVLPFLFIGFLSRRKDTYLIRLSLLPVILVLTIRGTFVYGGTDDVYSFYTWLRGIYLTFISCLLRWLILFTRSWCLVNHGNDSGLRLN